MTRNQLKQSTATKFAISPIFTVDIKGNIQPTPPQDVARNSEFLIQSADLNNIYQGYVCALWGGACQCAALVSDLYGEPHMKVSGTSSSTSSSTSYTIASTALAGDYTLFTTTSETGDSEPTPGATNGQIHIGG